MIEGILAAFRSYTPDDLEDKTLPELCRLYVRARRVIQNHPTLVSAWKPPEVDPEEQNDPDLADDFR